MSIPLSAFEHKKGILISFDSICLIFLSLSVFLLAYLEQTGNFDFDYWFTLILAIWFIYLIFFLISRFFLHEIEFGQYKGTIILKIDSIKIIETEFTLDEISTIKIHSSDIKGEIINHSIEFSRKLSNGLKNEITLKLKNGNIVKTHFLQTKNERIKFSKEFLINYHKKGKISWLQLLDILEINNYDEIQNFKKEINSVNKIMI